MPSRVESIWAVVPVKDFSRAKGRLGKFMGASDRTRLARAMAQDVIAALKCSNAADRLCMLSDSPGTRELAVHLGATWLDENRVAALPGLNAGIAGVAHLAGRSGATALLVTHADMPLLTAADILHVVSVWHSLKGDQRVVMARSHDGGTNILLAEHAEAFAYQYGPDSHARHLRECARRQCVAATVELPGAALDIDTVDDFFSLARAAREGRCGIHTAALLEALIPAAAIPDVSPSMDIAS